MAEKSYREGAPGQGFLLPPSPVEGVAGGTDEDVGLRVIGAGQHPHFTTVNEFRLEHWESLAGLFGQVYRMCRRAGMVKLGQVALDGAKIKGSASKHKAMSYQRMQQGRKGT